jgi:hypothetical protein
MAPGFAGVIRPTIFAGGEAEGRGDVGGCGEEDGLLRRFAPRNDGVDEPAPVKLPPAQYKKFFARFFSKKRCFLWLSKSGRF